MRPRPTAEASRSSGVEIEVRAIRGRDALPPITLPGEPASVRDAWAECWRYADEIADGDPGAASVAWLAVSRHFPALIRAEIVERLHGLDYSTRPFS
jgi:hypothetical protein